MLIAHMYGHIITPGTEIEVPGFDDQFKFQVVAIREKSFKVVWLLGKQAGVEDVVPYSLFGDAVKVSEITDNNEPNQAFKYRKLMDG